MPRFAHPPRSRPLFVLVAAVVLALAPAARAQSYTVSDIEVNAAAGDAVQAQAIALEEGQRQGLRRLLERLAEGGAVPSTSGLDIDRYVTSFEVLSEQVGPTTYAATLTVNYDRGAVRSLLDREGVAYVAESAPPVTLVPLWESDQGLRLWEADNAWKRAWDGARSDEALQPVVVPLGDLQDLALVDGEQAVRGDAGSLRALAARYGTDDVVVARLRGSGAPGAPLEVQAQRIGDAGTEPYRATVRRDAGEPLEASLARAVAEMQAALDERARRRATVPAGRPEPLVVSATVQGLDSWGRLLGLLDGLAEVESAVVREFSRERAVFDLRVRGGAEGLQPALGRAGWRLQQGQDGWQLVQGTAAATPSPL